jgi:uncharacterized protein (DUF1015 family)
MKLEVPSTQKTQKNMTDFRPFQAWRYNPEKIDFNKVITPPYDVISPAQQHKFYERSPYNFIRLELNRPEAFDNERSNVYTRARDTFQNWCATQVLIQETEPAFYLYRQVFLDPASGATNQRTALFGRLHLEPFEKEIVIPHEKTLSKAREDRRKLLETTETNFSPVFGLYEDEKREIAALYDQVTREKKVLSATGDDGVEHYVGRSAMQN